MPLAVKKSEGHRSFWMEASMEQKIVTETHIGNTRFIVTSECSPTATETIQKKLERLLCRRLSDTKSYPPEPGTSLAVCRNQSEHGVDTM
jgi:hypothetical protein